jgi:hypothetical protein
VDNLKGKILFASMIVALAILAFSPAANANVAITIYGYTDKTNYNPGDTVTLTFFIYESGTDQVVLANATVRYPWYSKIWGGNQTINANNAVIAQGKNWNATVKFTIPTDGRATSGNIVIYYYYTFGSTLYYDNFPPVYLHVNSLPTYASLQDMDQITTLLTVQTVLLIVSALIIAAAVFLSARRPKVTWTAEQKE